jgi:hypothetical protein
MEAEEGVEEAGEGGEGAGEGVMEVFRFFVLAANFLV